MIGSLYQAMFSEKGFFINCKASQTGPDNHSYSILFHIPLWWTIIFVLLTKALPLVQLADLLDMEPQCAIKKDATEVTYCYNNLFYYNLSYCVMV